MNLNKLKGKMVEHERDAVWLADILGISRASVYRKFNDFETFTIGDALKIKEALPLSDADAIDIFLS